MLGSSKHLEMHLGHLPIALGFCIAILHKELLEVDVAQLLANRQAPSFATSLGLQNQVSRT